MKALYLVAAIVGAIVPYVFFSEHFGSSGFGLRVRLQHVNQCYGQTLAEAVETIDNEHLTRIHAG